MTGYIELLDDVMEYDRLIIILQYGRMAVLLRLSTRNGNKKGTYGMLSRIGVSFALFYLRSGYKKHAQYLPRQREGKVNEHLEELKWKCFFYNCFSENKGKRSKIKKYWGVEGDIKQPIDHVLLSLSD